MQDSRSAGALPSGEGEEEPMSEMDELKHFCLQMQRELQMHREVLEQWLEVREGLMELAQHRDTLLQCLELREGIQVVLNSSQVIRDMDTRASELELSLAGVSDNIARHGKALSSLTEHQQRTTLTIDAVVRAVKRLDRSRSRGRVGATSTGYTGSDYGSQGAFGGFAGAYVDREQVPVMPHGNGAGVRHGAEECGALGGQFLDMPDERGAFADPDGAGDWLDGVDPEADVFSFDVPRIIGGNSSCGFNVGHSRHKEVGAPRRSSRGASARRRGADDGHAGGAQPEMENCVRGVLARIEEALYNLDGTGDSIRRANVGANSCSGSDPGGAMMGGTAASKRSSTPNTNRRGASSGRSTGTARSAGHAGHGAGEAPPNRNRHSGPSATARWVEANSWM